MQTSNNLFFVLIAGAMIFLSSSAVAQPEPTIEEIFIYDELGRLVRVISIKNGAVEETSSYTFDALGNRRETQQEDDPVSGSLGLVNDVVLSGLDGKTIFPLANDNMPSTLTIVSIARVPQHSTCPNSANRVSEANLTISIKNNRKSVLIDPHPPLGADCYTYTVVDRDTGSIDTAIITIDVNFVDPSSSSNSGN